MAFLSPAAYPWVKSLHVFSVLLWMGAQVLLPALLAASRGKVGSGGWLALARWLVQKVMNPAMALAFLCGGLMAATLVEDWSRPPAWLAAKLALIFILASVHGLLYREYRRWAKGRGRWEEGHYRRVQWLDLGLLMGVVVLVVAKPLP